MDKDIVARTKKAPAKLIIKIVGVSNVYMDNGGLMGLG